MLAIHPRRYDGAVIASRQWLSEQLAQRAQRLTRQRFGNTVISTSRFIFPIFALTTARTADFHE